MATGSSAVHAVDEWQDVSEGWQDVPDRTQTRPIGLAVSHRPTVELPPFPVDDWIHHQVKDLPPEQQAEKRSGFTSFMYALARPWQDLGYSAAAGLNRGLANFAAELDTLDRYAQAHIPGKRGEGTILQDVPKQYEANAQLWDSMIPKEGVGALDKLYQWGGKAAGSMIPGTAQFLMDWESGLTIPYLRSVQHARERGDSYPTIAGITEAAKIGMLGTMFKMVGPLQAWMKAGVLGTYFGADEAINAKPGERAKGFLEGAATGGLLGITTPGGKYGLRDIYPEIGRNATSGETVAPTPVPPPMPEGLQPVTPQEGQQAPEKVGTKSEAATDTGLVKSGTELDVKNVALVSGTGPEKTLLRVELSGTPKATTGTDFANQLFPEQIGDIRESRLLKKGPMFSGVAGTHTLEVEFKDTASADRAMRAMSGPKQPDASASVQGPDTKLGFVAPDGKPLDGEQAKEWVKKNEPAVYEELPETEKLTAEDYSQARDTVAASQRALPLGAASALPIDNPPTFTPRTEPSGIWGAVGRVFHSMYKAVTLDILPELSDAGLSNNAVQHAHARAAVPKIVDDLLARVFPEEYRNPKKMEPFIDLLNKDNILGGYDAFLLNASEARKAEDEATAGKWDRLADKVKQAHDLDAYDAEVQKAKGNKKFMETVGRWQDNVSPKLDQLYNEMKQVDTFTQRDSRGRHLDSRINLLSEDVAARWNESLTDLDKPMPGPSASSYRNPNVKRDPTDVMATFTGEYSTDARAVLSAVVGHRWNEVTKLRFYNDLVDTVAIKATGQEAPEGYSRMAFKIPQTDANGRTRTVEQSLFVPKNMVREIRSVLGTDMRLQQNMVGKILTGIQLAQLADLTTHTKNIVSVVTRAQGAGDIWTDAGRKIPGLGSVDALWRLAKTTREVLQDTPEMRAEIAQMAQRGLVRPEFPSTGLQKITRGQQIIHEADTAARVVMNRFFDNLVERKLVLDTEENRRGFVNQVGEYNSRLEGPIMRAAKESGIAPFIVAGRNFNRQGRWALTGNPGVEAASMNAAVQMRVLNLLGTAALFTLPMMLNQLTTGKVAGRSGTPVGAWDLGLDPDENGKHKVIDLLSWTGIRRGMRSIGLDALAQGLMNGDHWNDIIGNALQDAGNTIIHPWNGPATAFVEKTATGKQLDIRGKMEAEKIPEGGGLQFLENFRAALESQNPLVYSIVRPAFQEAGLDQKVKPSYGQDVVTNLLKSPAQAIGARDITPPPSDIERRKRDLEIAKERMKKDIETQMGVSRKDQKRRFTILKRRAASGE